MDNKNLKRANEAKNDEFYTQYKDIEKEISYYREYLKNKTVYLNCDNPEISNFWKYFRDNFYELGIKKLVCTHYEKEKPTYKMEIFKSKSGQPSFEIKTPLIENGDFASNECVDLLKKCDIVITNPPFSLFRVYVDLLMKNNKNFIIIGPVNAMVYGSIFPLFMNNKIRFGYNGLKKFFDVKNNSIKNVNCAWFTNYPVYKQNQPLPLTKSYFENPENYPKYDNYDAIECSSIRDIPYDYFEHIGVPIYFLEKHCPEQFDIINCSNFIDGINKIADKGTYKPKAGKGVYIHIDKLRERERERERGNKYQYRQIFTRIIIKRRKNCNNP